jgi:hypothetical protein
LGAGNISARFAAQIFQSLSRNDTLTYFGLTNSESDGKFGLDAFIAMIEFIPNNCVLQSFFAWNFVSDSSASFKDLEAALEVNYSLEFLRVEPTGFSTRSLTRNQVLNRNLKKMILFFAVKNYCTRSLDKYVFEMIFDLAIL